MMPIDSTLGCPCRIGKCSHADSSFVDAIRRLGGIPILKTSVPWHLLFSDTTSPLSGVSKDKKYPNSSLGGRCGALALAISNAGKSIQDSTEWNDYLQRFGMRYWVWNG